MENENVWKVIHRYFEDNPQNLVTHHIESYNDFFKKGIFQIFKEKNPVEIFALYDNQLEDYKSKCIMHFGGKDGNKIYFGKPIIYDNDNNIHFMYPNEARLRNMTYGMTVHYDVDIEFINILDEGEEPDLLIDEDLDGGAKKGKVNVSNFSVSETKNIMDNTNLSLVGKNIQKREITLEKVYLGKFPIMLQSDFCILKGLPKTTRFNLGECLNDIGGYFIIDGKEKTIISQEKFGDNNLYIRSFNEDNLDETELTHKFVTSAEIKSVSENVSKPRRNLIVGKMTNTGKNNKGQIVVTIPNVRQDIPLFILFRALGIISDKKIISYCLLDFEKNEQFVDDFISSVHDADFINTQQDALFYIGTLTKGKTIHHALEIITDYLFPHIGETNYNEKAFFLGHMVFEMLKVNKKITPPTDRDHMKYKRIELVGSLMYDLFRDYFTIQQRKIQLDLEKIVNYSKNIFSKNLYGLIMQNRHVFGQKMVEEGFKTAMKGNWGAHSHTKRVGIVQDLNRLSFNSMLSHLRKTNLPFDSSLKIVGPRLLHGSQWGFIDPIDTPDGGNIGLHKHLSISTYISQPYTRDMIIIWMKENISLKPISDFPLQVIETHSKVFVNGYWCGMVEEPFVCVEKMKLYKRNGLIPIYTSISFDIKANIIYIFTDGGRLCRPIFYFDTHKKKFSFENEEFIELLEKEEISWSNMISGLNPKKNNKFIQENKIYRLEELYDEVKNNNPATYEKFLKNKAIIDYIDSNETEQSLIALNKEQLLENKDFTHMEIHPSLVFGVMCNLINFPENNPGTRNSFSCGQSKQACSLYHSNYQVRLDKTGIVLNYGQSPLVRSRYTEYINNNENSYGENTIVAIMCYTGYNVEDAILINEGAIQRGLFKTTYYSCYEKHEEKEKINDEIKNKIIKNIENDESVVNLKDGFDYSKLDKHGLIREETEVNDKTIIIGMTVDNTEKKNVSVDMSTGPKKGQKGIVDKSFITEGEEGSRIAKVRIRENRVPAIGDKMASRAGQKGTIGMIIPEIDMPFTKDGLKPDLIINPHAIPTRMTIGQLVECLVGKASAEIGCFGDCTAFANDGSKIGIYGKLLTDVGFHSTGNETLYNGMTGQQLESEVFIGPNYYMRLKHMVKDKINYRSLGPNVKLTNQPVSGRANDGGLRIGEMERDGLISHGASEFLRESMNERADKYHIAVCNSTGLMCLFNPSKNLFISPMLDGPIKFINNVDNELNLDNITKFGRSFSILSVPYSFKLLMQELMCINVQMRIITDENIEQIESMTNSLNIPTLLNDKKTTKQIVSDINKAISQKEPVFDLQKEKTPSPETDNEDNNDSLSYHPSPSPSVEYAIGTPRMIPRSPDDPPNQGQSPLYQPQSPDYPPNQSQSPLYQPQSPDYPPIDDNSPSTTDVTSGDSFSPNESTLDSSISQTTGGNSIKETLSTLANKFEISQQVLYGGDNKHGRVWTITKIADPFIHIETDDVEGLDIADLTKIVSPTDIRKTSDIIQSKIQEDILPMTPNQPFNNNQHGGDVSSTGQPVINFNPVFKMMNGGNDFSTGGEENQQSEHPNGNNNIQELIPTATQEGGPSINTTKLPELKQTNSNTNFDKLVIKKIE